jgi:lipoate-protein ligase A
MADDKRKQQTEKWLLVLDGAYSPYMNMAIDELLLEKSCSIKKPILRFYSWDRPSVSIGYIQKYAAAPQKEYNIVRRPTGGGIVFHDVDLTYTVEIPKGHRIEKLDRTESYHVFHRAIIKSLYELGINSSLVNYETKHKDRMTMQCFVAPTKYDIVLDDELSSKAAGAAQRRTKYGILHQGSIVLENIQSYSKKLTDCMIKSIKREFNVEFETYSYDLDFLNKAKLLSEYKYKSEGWNKIR